MSVDTSVNGSDSVVLDDDEGEGKTPRFSNAQCKYLLSLGVPSDIVEQLAPTRTRTNADDRAAAFAAIFAEYSVGNGMVKIPIGAFVDRAGPAASVTNPTYWSGLGVGSDAAFDAGCKSALKGDYDAAMGGMRYVVQLTPLTAEQRAKHEKSRVDAERKAAERKAQAEADGEDSDGAAEEAPRVRRKRASADA